MSSNHRFVKFWPQDWQRDPALRSCGIAARGLWIDLLCIMHEGEPYGHLTVNGRAMTVRQVGTISGIGEKEAGKLLAELEEAGVFSRAQDGTIYSRRMVRDSERSQQGRDYVSKRGGPWAPNTPPNRSPTSGPTSSPVTQEARSKKQETPPLTPPRGAGRFRNGFLAVIAEEGMPSQPEEGQLRAVID